MTVSNFYVVAVTTGTRRFVEGEVGEVHHNPLPGRQGNAPFAMFLLEVMTRIPWRSKGSSTSLKGLSTL